MPTIRGLRRRGYPAAALRAFCAHIGLARVNGTHEIELLESFVRTALNRTALRRAAVLRPLKVTITNWLEGRVEMRDRSLNERVVRHCRDSGLSDDAVELAQLAAFRQLGIDEGIDFDDPLVAPYRDYLNGESRFVLTAKPNAPVGLSQIDLYKPSDVPALLNLTAATR